MFCELSLSTAKVRWDIEKLSSFLTENNIPHEVRAASIFFKLEIDELLKAVKLIYESFPGDLQADRIMSLWIVDDQKDLARLAGKTHSV